MSIETRLRKLERPTDEYYRLLRDYGDALPRVIDCLETTLADWRGVPRSEVKIDVRREGLLDQFTHDEVVKLHDAVVETIKAERRCQ